MGSPTHYASYHVTQSGVGWELYVFQTYTTFASMARACDFSRSYPAAGTTEPIWHAEVHQVTLLANRWPAESVRVSTALCARKRAALENISWPRDSSVAMGMSNRAWRREC